MATRTRRPRRRATAADGVGGVLTGTRREMTAEDRERRRQAGKAKAEAALERLDEAVRRIVEDDDAFAEYLRLSGRMHNYSWGNRLLVFVQRPDAGLVAGFHRWKELGRPVCKGSKGIQILAPMTRKWEDKESGEEVARVVGFRVTYVFSVRDTDGPPVGTPTPLPPEDDGETARAVCGILERACTAHGCSVELRESDALGTGVNGKPAGWYSAETSAIVVNGALPAAHRAKTLAHELAHHVAGKAERADAETVAEGAAFVVAGHLGLDTEGYSAPYVASWAQDMKRVRALLEEIAKVAGDIIGSLDECPECGYDGGAEGGCEACMV